MSPERPLGSIEERQAERAIVKARAQRPDLYPMSGGAGLPDATTLPVPAGPELLISSEERERRERQRRQEGLLVGLAEKLLRTNNPEAMIWHVRRTMAAIEAVAEMPKIEWADMPRLVLAEKAAKFEDAARDPEFAKTLGYDEEGLIENVIVRDALRPDGRGGFEIELSGGEAAVLLGMAQEALGSNVSRYIEENGRQSVSLSGEQVRILRSVPETRRILDKKETITIPPRYSPEELKTIAETARKLEQEILARIEITTIGYYLYQSTFFSISGLASLDARYTGISTDKLRTLVSLGESKPGELLPFGDKVDAHLRLLCLIATIGGDRDKSQDPIGKDEKTKAEIKARDKKYYEEQRIKLDGFVDKQPQYLKDLINKEIEFQGEKKNGADWLFNASRKNLFSEPVRSTDDLKNLRDLLIKIVGGDTSDTQATGEIAHRLFRMWGIAAYYDCKSWKSGPGGERALVPFGAAVSDDTAGVQHFEQDRTKNLFDGYPHGPDATLGEYPDLMRSFLHSTVVGIRENPEDPEYRKLKNQRSLWELWWNDGRKLSELPWDKAGPAAWFRYNYQLGNIGKKEKGVYAMAMTPLPAQKLIDVEALRDLVKTIKLSITATTIHGGEIENWLKTQKPEVGEYTSLDDKFLDPLREEIGELILIGAITSDYQNNVMEATKYWGEWVRSNTTEAENIRKVVWRVMNQAGWGNENWWKENIISPAKEFLKSEGLI